MTDAEYVSIDKSTIVRSVARAWIRAAVRFLIRIASHRQIADADVTDAPSTPACSACAENLHAA